ncbi:hypothetical protein LCGC14_2701170 [marine sediment metagenome]|uniref:Uncharacterized protein n=1 Tax=marine sediment metagenome TaxID=412755 RepID=A0A0F8ZFP3_9ZZZZ
MSHSNTSKEVEKAHSEALSKSDNTGKDEDVVVKGDGEKELNSEKSESWSVNQVKIVTPNNYGMDAVGPVAQGLEIERKENYLTHKGFGM